MPVLDRLARPYDPELLVAALLGLPARLARQVVGTVVATSPEAEALLAAMPEIVRSLAIATNARPTRCVGELRGPVLWSETMSARSATAGDPGLYVCATTAKAYDTDGNRVLVAALATVRDAGDAAAHGLVRDPIVRRAHTNSHRAGRFLDHQTLASVPVEHVRARTIRRALAGTRRRTYHPAVAVLRRAREPLDAAQLAVAADPATTADHDLLVEVLDAVGAQLGTTLILRTRRGALVAGPVAYRHAGTAAAEHAPPAGVTVHGRPVRQPADALSALAKGPSQG